MAESPEELQRRLEYTARQKALYDYNTMMEESYERGIEWGKQQGKKERDMELVQKMRAKGVDESFIKQFFGNV